MNIRWILGRFAGRGDLAGCHAGHVGGGAARRLHSQGAFWGRREAIEVEREDLPPGPAGPKGDRG